MSAFDKPSSRNLLIGVVAGLIVGCLFGWLIVGWLLWPVQYVGDAYTYELNDASKTDYVAAVVDSYNLNRRLDLVSQRFAQWKTDEKVNALADLFVQYQIEGRAQEAQQIMTLASMLNQAEGWDPALVDQTLAQLEAQYTNAGEAQQAQYLTLFANELGVMSAPVTEEGQPVAAGQSAESSSGGIRTLLPLLLLLLFLVLLLAAAVYLFMKRRGQITRPQAVSSRVDESAWIGEGSLPLLIKKSTYRLGMDNFDESFSIEDEDGAFKGECGIGISETMGDESPRRAMAFEVWLFDKSDIRTVTKVLMSEYAYNNENLRNKLAARGEPILAQPGQAISLETTALAVEARIVEMEYGDGEPASSYFNSLTVSLVANIKPATEESDFSTLPPTDED